MANKELNADKTDESTYKKREFWTKRRVLYLVNAISLVVVIICFIFEIIGGSFQGKITDAVITFIIIQVAFSFLSLVVYYLSIVADSLRYRKKNDDSNHKNN